MEDSLIRSVAYILLSVLSCKNSTSSNMTTPQPDVNLQKYSYFIFGVKTPNTINQGTGFFVREQERLFFITAAHTITGWSPITGKNDPGPLPGDIFQLRLYKDNTEVFIPLDFSKHKQSYVKKLGFDQPDLFVMEIKNLNFEINSIESYFMKYPLTDSIHESQIFGFPVLEENDPNKYVKAPASKLEAELGFDYKKKIYWQMFNKYDSINYQLKILNSFSTLHGYSGSPVFHKIGNKREIVFGGVLFSGDPPFTFVIRPEYILEEIKKVIKN